MPRAARALADNEVYHVLNRGNGRATVFHKATDFAAFVKLIAEAKERYPVKVLAYCLMSNHFHLLVKPEKGEDLSKWMRWLMTSHVRRYHRHHGTSGHIWQGRFKSFIVKGGDHLLTVARYVEGNPVQAGMVRSAIDWPWSSHRENLGTVGTVPPFGTVPVATTGVCKPGQAPTEPVPDGNGTGTCRSQSQAVTVPFEETLCNPAQVPTKGENGTGTYRSQSQAVTVPFEETICNPGQVPTEPVPVIDAGLLDLPADWADYVDLPITDRELNRLKLSLHRGVTFEGTGTPGACPGG